jgi:hypothetical protein
VLLLPPMRLASNKILLHSFRLSSQYFQIFIKIISPYFRGLPLFFIAYILSLTVCYWHIYIYIYIYIYTHTHTYTCFSLLLTFCHALFSIGIYIHTNTYTCCLVVINEVNFRDGKYILLRNFLRIYIIN